MLHLDLMDRRDRQRSNESRRDDLFYSLSRSRVRSSVRSDLFTKPVETRSLLRSCRGNSNMPLLYRQVVPMGLAPAAVIHLCSSESLYVVAAR